MPASVERGTIVYREWGEKRGLTESEEGFASIDELFALCLRVDDPRLVDRIVLSGLDGDGEPRTVTFAFQAVSKGRE